MVYTRDIEPLFRDADENGLVGVRGFLNYFQDAASRLTHEFRRGNDTMPQEFGVAWLYTKYRLRVLREADFTAPFHAECWMEQSTSKVRVSTGFEVSRGDTVFAQGRLESSLFNPAEQRLVKLAEVGFPPEAFDERAIPVGSFVRMKAPVREEMEPRYVRTVRFSDLDNNHHMANLRYVGMLLDAFDGGFYAKRRPSLFEIHYTSQCYEGEAIDVRVRAEEPEGSYLIAAFHEDGAPAVVARLETVVRDEAFGKR